MFVVRLRLHAMFLFSTVLIAVRLHNCRQICEMSSNESRQKTAEQESEWENEKSVCVRTILKCSVIANHIHFAAAI